jgi:hypothetical protein
MSNPTKMKTKIELLLAKAEGTDNDHERDAYTAKAQRLMLEWGIAEADLEARGEVKPETVVETHRVYTGIYAIAMMTFGNAIASGMGNLRVFKSGTRTRFTLYVVGHETDVANFWTMMDSLDRQAHAARKAWWKVTPEREWMTGQEGYKAQRDFVLAFGAVCGKRLRELRQEVQVEATPGAALVLVSKAKRVDDYMEQNHRLRPSRSTKGGMSGSRAGAEAGARANIGNSVEGNRAGVLA